METIFPKTPTSKCIIPKCNNKGILCSNPNNYNDDEGQYSTHEYLCREHAVEFGFCGGCGMWEEPYDYDDVKKYRCKYDVCFCDIEFKGNDQI